MNDQIIATKHQLDTILEVLIKNNIITEKEFMEMLNDRLNRTLMSEMEKSQILTLVDFNL